MAKTSAKAARVTLVWAGGAGHYSRALGLVLIAGETTRTVEAVQVPRLLTEGWTREKD